MQHRHQHQQESRDCAEDRAVVDALPMEMWVRIFSHITAVQDIFAAMLVNQRWRELAAACVSSVKPLFAIIAAAGESELNVTSMTIEAMESGVVAPIGSLRCLRSVREAEAAVWTRWDEDWREALENRDFFRLTLWFVTSDAWRPFVPGTELKRWGRINNRNRGCRGSKGETLWSVGSSNLPPWRWPACMVEAFRLALRANPNGVNLCMHHLNEGRSAPAARYFRGTLTVSRRIDRETVELLTKWVPELVVSVDAAAGGST
jgi:hypothetical protein